MIAITLRFGVVLEDATHGVAGETYMVSPGFAASLLATDRAQLAAPIPAPGRDDAPVVPVVAGKPAQKRTRS